MNSGEFPAAILKDCEEDKMLVCFSQRECTRKGKATKMSERNWQKDWELCQRATPGPWYVGKRSKYAIFTDNGRDVLGNKCKKLPVASTVYGYRGLGNRERDAEFIAEAREALPYWLQRVRVLEAKNRVLQKQLTVLTEAAREVLQISPEFNDDIDRLVRLQKVISELEKEVSW